MSVAETEDGEKIFYRVTGDKNATRTVVMIQGLGLSHKFWFSIPDDLAKDPARPRRVIALDNRGTGQSSRAKPPYTMKRLADDVACVLRDANVDRAFLVGISMGGMVAQHVALRHASKVQGLVLMATMPGLPHARLPAPRTIAKLIAIGTGRDKSGKIVAELLLPRAEMHRAREHFSGWIEEMRASPPSPASFAGQFAAIAGHSTGFALAKI
ncbi:MAG: alpha/beta fold hydrolase, partial [Polyangiaceae bacterium]